MILRQPVIYFVSIAFGAHGIAAADQIITTGENFAPVEVITFEDGAVKFRRPEGRVESAWIDQITMIVVDRGGFFDDFNQAERFIQSHEHERAISRYKRALRSAEGHWQALIAARAVAACDQAGQLDDAVQYWVILLRGPHGGLAGAARMMPQHVPTSPSGRVDRALRFLDGALAVDPPADERALLVLVRYAILKRVGDDRTTLAAEEATTVELPEPARTAPVYEIQWEAFRHVLNQATADGLLAPLDQALRTCPDGLLPRFLMLKGETLSLRTRSRDDLLRAAWPYLRVAIHFPDDPLAPAALSQAALILERAGLVDKARGLWEEAIRHSRGTNEVRDEARRRLEILRESSPPEPAPP